MNFNPFKKFLDTKENSATVSMMVNGFRIEYPAKSYLILLRDGYERNPVGRFCVDKIARSVGTVPFKVQKSTGKGKDEFEDVGSDHPMQKLISKPSIYHTEREFKETITKHALIGGTAFIGRLDPNQPLSEKIQRANEVMPTELYTLPPQLVKQVLTKGTIAEYWFESPYGRVTYKNNILATTPANMSLLVEFRIGNPRDDLSGLSPLASAAADIDIINEGKLYNLGFLKNGMRPSGILSFLKTLGKPAKNDIRKQLDERHTGSINAGRPLITEDSEVKWHELNVSQKDADYIQLNQESSKSLALSIGVPPIFLGIKGDSTYSNYEEANKAFWLETASYYCDALAEQFTDWLAPLYGRPGEYRVIPDYSDVPAMISAQVAEIKDLDVYTINEKRARFGLEPLEGGDVLLPHSGLTKQQNLTVTDEDGIDPNQ